jgi:hypothetical protein
MQKFEATNLGALFHKGEGAVKDKLQYGREILILNHNI